MPFAAARINTGSFRNLRGDRVRVASAFLICAALQLLSACGGGGSGGGSSSPPPQGPGGGGTPAPPPTAQTVTIGGTVSGLSGSGLVLQNNDGDDLSVASDGAFVFRTAVAADTGSYHVTVKRRPANPMQTCTVTDGSGTASRANVTNIAVKCSHDHARFIYQYEPLLNVLGVYRTNEHSPQLRRTATLAHKFPHVTLPHPNGKFLYLIPEDEDLMYGYSVDAAGALTAIGPPIQAGAGTLWGFIHPNGRFLFLSNVRTDQIARFAIAENGTVSALTPVLLPPGSYPRAASMTSDGRYLIVGNTGGPAGQVKNVAAFAINAESGALTPLAGSPFETPVSPEYVWLGANDTIVYATTPSSFVTAAYRLDSTNGTLAALPPIRRSTGTADVLAHPVLPLLYLAPLVQGTTPSKVEAFAIDESTGQLLPLPGAPVDVGDEILSFMIDPTGRFLYVYCRNSLRSFSIDPATGRLTDPRIVSGPRYMLATSKTQSAVTHRAKFVFTANDSANTVSAFKVDRTTGALTAINTSLPVRGRALLTAVDSRARFLYTGNDPGVVYGHSIDAEGRVSPINTAGGAHAVSLPEQLVIHPTDRFLFVSSWQSKWVFSYSIDANTGAMSTAGNAPAPYSPGGMAMHPDGTKLYVLSGAQLVSIYGVSATAQLTRLLDRNVSATNLALHPNGKFLYLVNTFGNIDVHDSDLPAGAAPQTVQLTRRAHAIRIDPTGRFAYALTDRDILGFTVDAATGALTGMPDGLFDPAATPVSLSFDADGSILYVSTAAPNAVTAYQVDSRTGALTKIGDSVTTPGYPRGVIAAGVQE